MQDPSAQRMLQHWVDVVGDLLLRPQPTMPIEQLLEELYLTFGTEVSWAWRDADETFGFLMYEPIPGWPVDGQLEFWAHEAMALHPLIHWFRETGDLTPTTLERVPAEVADPRGLQILRHHLLPVGLEQQLSIPYRQTSGGTYRAFVLAKGGDDFTDAEVGLAQRIQPLLILLARQCCVLVGYAADDRPDGTLPDGRDDNGGSAGALGLTGRELAVLRLLADGKTAGSIGRTLGISPRTVHVHLTHVYGKLGVNSPSREPAWVPMIPRQRHQEAVPTTEAELRGERAVAWRPGVGAILFDPAP